MQENNSSAGEIIGGIFAFVVIGLFIWGVLFLTQLRTVSTGEVGVVTSFGNVTGRELDEGLSLVAPLWFENVTSYSVKTQKESASAAAATKDLQDVTGTVVVNYRLERGEVSEMHKTVGEEYVDILVRPAIQEVFKASTAKYTAVELQTTRDKIKNDVVAGLKSRLTDRGITIEDVSIVNLEYSKEFTKAIEQRQVAQQNAERARYNLEKAKLDAQSQDVQAKTLTKEYLQMLAIEKWNGKLPNAVGGTGMLFNIPIK